MGNVVIDKKAYRQTIAIVNGKKGIRATLRGFFESDDDVLEKITPYITNGGVVGHPLGEWLKVAEIVFDLPFGKRLKVSYPDLNTYKLALKIKSVLREGVSIDNKTGKVTGLSKRALAAYHSLGVTPPEVVTEEIEHTTK